MPTHGEIHPRYRFLLWNGQKWTLLKNPDKEDGKCKTKFCRNYARVEYRFDRRTGKRRMSHHGTCTKCQAAQWRENNPAAYAYKNLKHSAKGRRIPFTLTFEEFVVLCEETHYLAHKGTSSECLHVDRIDASRGYEAGNVQVITCSENVGKGNRERHLPDYVQAQIAKKRNLATEELGSEVSVVKDFDDSWVPEIDGVLCPF